MLIHWKMQRKKILDQFEFEILMIIYLTKTKKNIELVSGISSMIEINL